MWKLLLSVRALKSGKGEKVIWEVQVGGKPFQAEIFEALKRLLFWFRFMNAEPNFVEQIPKMRRMSRLSWFESLNISSWDLIKLESQVLFKTFSIFILTHSTNTKHLISYVFYLYIFMTCWPKWHKFSKETLYLHILKVFRFQGLIQKLGLGGLIISGWSDRLDCEAVSKGGFGLSGWIAGFP